MTGSESANLKGIAAAAPSTARSAHPPLKRVGSAVDNTAVKVDSGEPPKLPNAGENEPHKRIESRSSINPKNGIHGIEVAESSSGFFKVPKKLLVSDSREGTRVMSSATSTPSVETFSISIPQPPKVTDVPPALPSVVQNGILGGPLVTPNQTSLSLPLLERATMEGAQLVNKTTNNTPSVEISSLIGPSANETSKADPNEHIPPSESKDTNVEGDQADSILSSSPVKLSINAISNLNKSLKAKQKIINSKDPHPRNVTATSDILNTSPHASSAAINLHDVDDTKPDTSKVQDTDDAMNPVGESSSKQPDLSNNNNSLKLKPIKNKRISKQASTKTDFFAAKLASAVDDADSSDSDETFVYENNDAAPSADTPEANNTLTTNDLDPNGSIAFNINNKQPVSTFGDNASVTGSVIPTTFNSPTFEREEYQESVYSLHSSKPPSSPPLQAVGGGGARVPPLLSANNSFNSNNYLENFMKEKRPPLNQKSFSAYSFNEDNLNSHKEVKEVFDSECDDADIDEEAFSEGESESGRMSTVVIRNNVDSNLSGPEKHDETDAITVAPISGLNAQGAKKKKMTPSITSSSKLRSTTSKLFDKKGSHPRRYSTIPDDIDIEDFDDELIYYDNNIRFPYNNSNTNFNEQSPLLTQNGQVRIPHYRSLNFNFNGGKRKPSNMKSKRFISANQPVNGAGNGSIHNVNMNPSSPVNDSNSPNYNGNNPNYDLNMFPFPYGKNNQYYYDIDEYDPELQAESGASSPMNRNDINLAFDDLGMNGNGFRSGSGRYGFPNKNDHFALPRKQSRELGTGPYFIRSFVYTVFSIFCILMLGFMMGFILASTKDLTEFDVSSIENPVVSQDELIFNMVVTAVNPGWFSINVQDVELDVFAKSGFLQSEHVYRSSVETVLLGTIYELETPLEFPGGFFDRHSIEQMTAVKLLSPGKNLTGVAAAVAAAANGNKDNSTIPDNSKKWEVIAKHPFDLIIRGVVKYTLPISLNVKSVVVNKVAYINPDDMSTEYRNRIG